MCNAVQEGWRRGRKSACYIVAGHVGDLMEVRQRIRACRAQLLNFGEIRLCCSTVLELLKFWSKVML